jgi:RNA polymerase-binding transcription factor DksA
VPTKKSTTKKTTSTSTAKKTAASRPAAKKTTSKSTAKKTATRKPAAKKTSAKKPAAKKTSAKKTSAKKPAAKKTSAKKTSAKKKATRKSPFGAKFVEAQRKELLAERAKHLHQAETLRQEADQLVADREPGDVQFDEESGDGDTIAVERERDLTLSAQAQESVRQIDQALARVDNGTYGICVISGDPIPKARLEAIPWAAERVEHKVGRLGRSWPPRTEPRPRPRRRQSPEATDSAPVASDTHHG